MKVLFLDIDGVLNSDATTRKTGTGWDFVDDIHIERLKRILDATGAKVVLSSTWRYDRDEPKLNSDFLELQDYLKQFDIEFYDYTPNSNPYQRGLEIQEWLDEHPEVEQFVILDDRDDMEPCMDHLVQTIQHDALLDEHVEEAIQILNKNRS